MSKLWRSIIWKEWREHQSLFLIPPIIIFGLALFVAFRVPHDSSEQELVWPLVSLTIFVLAFFSGIRAAAGERQQGTMAFSQALPVLTWKLAITKLIFGIFVFSVPLLIAIPALEGISWLIRTNSPNREAFYFPWIATVFMSALSLLLWTAAISVHRNSEWKAGLYSLVVFSLWWATVLGTVAILHERANLQGPPLYFVLAVLSGISPGGPGFLVSYRSQVPELPLFGYLALLGIVLHFGLAFWFIRRFGRERPEPSGQRLSSWIAWPWHSWGQGPSQSCFAAIVRKQVRESLPVLAIGLVVVLTVVAILPAFLFGEGPVLLLVSWLLVAYLVGAGAFLNELSSGVNTFWRSRPIEPAEYFWGKFLTCLALVAAPMIALLAFGWLNSSSIPWADESLLLIAITGICVYAAGVLSMCLARNHILGSCLTIAFCFFGIQSILGAIALLQSLVSESVPSTSATSLAEFMTAALVTAGVCTMAAWAVFQRDWQAQ